MSSDFLNIVQSQIDPTIVKAFNECRASRAGGLRFSLGKQNQDKEIDVTIWRESLLNNLKDILVQKVATSPDGAACVGTLADEMKAKPEGFVLTGKKTITCSRAVDLVDRREGKVELKRNLVVRIYTDAGPIVAELMAQDTVVEPAVDPIRPYLVPPGMVAAFAGQCPAGWTEFTAASGRFFVGANGVGEDGKKLDVATTGGKWSATIAADNLPDIKSKASFGMLQSLRGGPLGHYQGDALLVTTDANTGKQMNPFQADSQFVGGKKALATAPPWYSILYCQKQE